jgi:hypothetical protein
MHAGKSFQPPLIAAQSWIAWQISKNITIKISYIYYLVNSYCRKVIISNKSIICDRYLTTVLSWLVDFRSHCFSINQISLLQIFTLLFEINCTEINQSQSSNIFIYTINDVIERFIIPVLASSEKCIERLKCTCLCTRSRSYSDVIIPLKFTGNCDSQITSLCLTNTGLFVQRH